MIDENLLTEASKIIKNSKDIVVFTGAGSSTESGIADFRSEGGLWSRYDPSIYANYYYFLRDPSKFWEMHNDLVDILTKAEPNLIHTSIVELEKLGKIKAIITQNVDELHQSAGNIMVYEVHGNINRFNCFGCRASYNKDQVLRKLKKEKSRPPTCDFCAAPLKPSVVLFGESLPTFEIYQSQALSKKADVMLIAGSSLEVAPVCDLPLYTVQNGGKLIIVNDKPTHLEERAEVIIHHKTGIILPLIVEELKRLKAERELFGKEGDPDRIKKFY